MGGDIDHDKVGKGTRMSGLPSIVQTAELYRERRASPVEVTSALLERIRKVDRHLSAYTTLTPEAALSQATFAEEEMSSGRYRSVLHGIPVAVKDIIYTKGIPTCSGMPIHRNWVPSYDATVVTRLREAGAIILGKTTTTEGAGMFHHASMPIAKNPWNPDYWTGVSSSGSGVAVAADLCFGALGSDTGGSIRFPAAANGVTGLKPTWGRVSRYGVFPLAESLDTIGPIARTAADCAAILGVIAGMDASDCTTVPGEVPDYLSGLEGAAGARGLRIGVDTAFNNEHGDPEVLSRLEDALQVFRGIGAEIVEIEFPDPTEFRQYISCLSKVEAALAHRETYPARASEYGSWLSQRISEADKTDPMQLGRAIVERDRFKGALAQTFAQLDVIFLPVLVRPTPDLSAITGDPQNDTPWMFMFASILNHARVPTITLPCGLTSNGLPTAFQLVGPHLSEAVLFRAGHAFQQHTTWHGARPDLSWIGTD
ncbi:amidase [Bradyrhizobium mercantei]|uniref:amidase n=1 Tax=Bradyrhizobium mercantei TaxID=1904807 RepID=UPI001AECE01F|nr:amidase [Bradyrhizobium mercantei]